MAQAQLKSTPVNVTQPTNPQQPTGKGMVVGAVVYSPTNPVPQMPASVSIKTHPAAVTVGMQNPMLPGQAMMMDASAQVQPRPQQAGVMMNGSATGAVAVAVPAETDAGLMANTKEKTPMCLINELARYNKIQHQYTLTDEQGPAHKKNFYVKLKLGDEEYSASGASIKKAQHSAAAIGLEKTAFKHPPPKPRRTMGVDGHEYQYDASNLTNNITPTVELNAIAMKRGERTIYTPIEPQRPHYYPPPSYDFRGMYNQRYHYPRMPRVFYVSLKVGQREFIGEGHSRQAARHNAAEKALRIIRNLPEPKMDKSGDIINEAGIPIETGEHEGTDLDDLKSEISLVHEIALKRKMPVDFKVTSESGPPHMRKFVTQCLVGEFVTKGEGNSKKLSKKLAAKAMLNRLRELPSLPPSVVKPKPKNPVNKKKNRNLIKMQKAAPDYGQNINPISRLIQIQQAKKEKEPIYTLIEEKGLPRRREFVMQVQVGNQVCSGQGPNKKLAKRNAAEGMLQLLGYSKPAPQPEKSSLKTNIGPISPAGGDNKKVTFVDQDATGARQLVPGLILMPDASRGDVGAAWNGDVNQASVGQYQIGETYASPRMTASLIAKELLDQGASPTAEAIRKTGRPMVSHTAVVRPRQQLLYLAEVLGFQVQFTDFPKGNKKNEFLSLVSLSTNPPQVSHGAGDTIEASHDAAALTALRSLSESGIDSVTDAAGNKDVALVDGHVDQQARKPMGRKGSGGKRYNQHMKSSGNSNGGSSSSEKLANSPDTGSNDAPVPIAAK